MERRLMNYTEGLIRNTEFFTTAELAKKLKMNVQVITRKVQAGEIKAYKIGKEWRIPEQSVFTWLESHANTQAQPISRKKTSTKLVRGDESRELPSQPSKRKYLLEYILAQFEPNRTYSEEEIDNIISRYHHDFRTVRSEFIGEKMMDRVDGKYRRRTGYRFSN
jgi:excisionase family DNA binding protein